MKRILALAIAMILSVSLAACGSGNQGMQAEIDAMKVELKEIKEMLEKQDMPVNTEWGSQVDDPTGPAVPARVSDTDVEIVKEYIWQRNSPTFARSLLVIKNNASVTVDVYVSGTAFGVSDNRLGVANANFKALGPGEKSVVQLFYQVSAPVHHFDSVLEVRESEGYESAIKDLSFKRTDLEFGVIVDVTNNGTEPIEYASGHVLFVDQGDLLGNEEKFFIDADNEIKPGETISQQFHFEEEFDQFEFYLSGYRYKG